MRIRKLLRLSSLTPVPLSDPHRSGGSAVVQLQLLTQPQPGGVDAPSYDQPNQVVGGANKCPNSPDSGALEKMKNDCMTLLLLKEDLRDEVEAKEEKGHDFRKGSSSDLSLSCQHSEGGARRSWLEEEKSFPLKKRRGSFDKEEETVEKNAEMKTKLKTTNNVASNKKPSGKEGARKRGNGEVVEGSRCSRVNGRGWRCCQQTLVGYSLCEHHLGKGRLRSVNSVKNRSLAADASDSTIPLRIDARMGTEKEEEEDGRDEKKQVVVSGKRRVKLGVVKARSMSSLLGETLAATTVQDDVLLPNGVGEI